MKVVVAAALVVLFAGIARGDEVEKLRREVDELRERLMKEQDRAIEQARRFDQEKKRLLDRIDELEKKLAGGEKKEPEEKKADAEPDPRARIATQKVTCNFDDTPVEEVVQFLQDLTGLNVVSIAPAGRHKVKAQVKEVTVKAALDLMVGGIGWELDKGVVVVGTKKAPAPPKVDLPEALKGKLGQKVTLNFDETPIEEMVAFLNDLGVKDVSLADKAKRGAVTLRLKNVSALTAIELAVRQNGLTWKVSSGKLVIDAK